MRLRLAPVIAAALLITVAACSGDDSGTTTTTSSAEAPTTTSVPESTDTTAPPVETTLPPARPADFEVRPGVLQVAVLGAEPGSTIEVLALDAAGNGVPLTSGSVDEQGSLLFRSLEPGDYVLRTVEDAPAQSDPVRVTAVDEVPAAAFYAEQRLPAPGFGYITMRDGTTLSANVLLPGPPEDGPYPTVVEYSGYSPSNPDDTTFAQLYNTFGYAYVGVNMRGTGCSGGSFMFFEPSQVTDGYDVIEAVAAQPWVMHNKVGMVGVSYPGISQLFVAQSQPPSLAAITPLSVLDDATRSTLYVGGILNTGFAVPWAQDRVDDGEVYGQGWSRAMAESGDEICEQNQELRLQNPDLMQMIEDNRFYDDELGDPLAPWTFIDQIDVPVYLAGAWQDEQTGGRFPELLDRFTGSPSVFATLTNGLHTESIIAGVTLGRYIAFLDLYVAQRVPSFGAAALIAPIATGALTSASVGFIGENPFEGLTYEEALAEFESQPRIEILFEQGARDGEVPLAPLPRWVEYFDSWPIESAEVTPWYLSADGRLVGDPAEAEGGELTYTADPDATPRTFYTGGSNDIWSVNVEYDWQPNPSGTALEFLSDPLAEDTVVIGFGSADLWVASSTGDTDLEVTITEVRPDGTEVLVQGGWLRASQRTIDEARSSELRPVQAHYEADASPLPDGELTLVRVEIFPFAHAFRAGSQLRLQIDAPGGNKPVWDFRTISNGEEVTVGTGAAAPSRLVLAVVPGIDVPSGVPACGSLRGQPCRTYVPLG